MIVREICSHGLDVIPANRLLTALEMGDGGDDNGSDILAHALYSDDDEIEIDAASINNSTTRGRNAAENELRADFLKVISAHGKAIFDICGGNAQLLTAFKQQLSEKEEEFKRLRAQLAQQLHRTPSSPQLATAATSSTAARAPQTVTSEQPPLLGVNAQRYPSIASMFTGAPVGPASSRRTPAAHERPRWRKRSRTATSAAASASVTTSGTSASVTRSGTKRTFSTVEADEYAIQSVSPTRDLISVHARHAEVLAAGLFAPHDRGAAEPVRAFRDVDPMDLEANECELPGPEAAVKSTSKCFRDIAEGHLSLPKRKRKRVVHESSVDGDHLYLDGDADIGPRAIK